MKVVDDSRLIKYPDNLNSPCVNFMIGLRHERKMVGINVKENVIQHLGSLQSS